MKLVDDRRAPGATGVRFRSCWAFESHQLKDLIRKELEDCEHPVVHLCSGSSTLGDVRIDIDHPDADVRGDARSLPVDDVPTILCDPPWGQGNRGWSVRTRMRVVSEVVQAIQPGGKVLWYAPWQPASTVLTLEEAYVRELHQLGKPLNPPILGVWRRARSG